MSAGESTAVGGPLQPLSSDRCAHIVAPIADEAARIESIGDYQSTVTSGWHIKTIPLVQLGPETGFAVASAVEPANIDLGQVMYGINPFPGYTPVEEMYVLTQHMTTVPISAASNQITLDSGSYTFTVLPDQRVLPEALPVVALPQQIRVNGAALPAENGQLELPNADSFSVSFSTSDTGVFDYFRVTLFLISAAPNGKLQAAPVANVRTQSTTATFSRSSLQGNGYYTILVRAYYGRHGVATGDWSTVTYPYGWTQLYSSVFQAP